MSDEQRRRLEREARYDEKLADWLRCMREGHDPASSLGVGFAAIPGSRMRACKRCLLVYWEPNAISARDLFPEARTSVSGDYTLGAGLVTASSSCARLFCGHDRVRHGNQMCDGADGTCECEGFLPS